MRRLFRFVLICLAALTTFICFASCVPEDVCGVVTDWAIHNNNYVLYIDGSPEHVSYDTWLKSNVGDYICIYY